MSDRLHHDLATISAAATAAARPWSASTVAARGRRRHRRRIMAGVAVPVVAVVAAVGGVLASGGGGNGQHVSVTAPVHPHRAGSLLAVPPAVMTRNRGPGGTARCTLRTDPATEAPLAADLGPLRADPVAVSAVWIPVLVARSGCRSVVTTGSTATAGRLATALLASPVARGFYSCPAMINGGQVELVFQYRDAPRLSLVRLSLGGCRMATLPGGQLRLGGAAAAFLPLLHPPTWATSGLPVGGSGSLGASTATP